MSEPMSEPMSKPMSETVQEAPPAQENILVHALDIEARSVVLRVQEEVYPLDVIQGATYLFLDKAYVWLQRPAHSSRLVEVVLRSKHALPEDENTAKNLLLDMAGELGNELLNQALRKQIGEANGKIREFIMARAFFAGDVPSTVDKLLAELDAEEMATDPLEIAVPWATE